MDVHSPQTRLVPRAVPVVRDISPTGFWTSDPPWPRTVTLGGLRRYLCCSEPRTMVLCPGPRPGATCVLPVRSLSPQGAGPERPLFGHQGLLSQKLLIPRARRAVRELSTELHSRSSTLRAQRCPPPNPTTSGGPGAPPHGLPLTCCLSRPAVRSPRPQVDAPGVTLQAVPACPRIPPRPRSTQSPAPTQHLVPVPDPPPHR